jgi:hypothetical protein
MLKIQVVHLNLICDQCRVTFCPSVLWSIFGTVLCEVLSHLTDKSLNETRLDNFDVFHSCLSVRVCNIYVRNSIKIRMGRHIHILRTAPKMEQYSIETVKRLLMTAGAEGIVCAVLNTVCYLLVTLYDRWHRLNEIPWKEKESWLRCVWFVAGWLSRFILGTMRSNSEAWNAVYVCGTWQ